MSHDSDHRDPRPGPGPGHLLAGSVLGYRDSDYRAATTRLLPVRVLRDRDSDRDGDALSRGVAWAAMMPPIRVP